MSHHPIHREPPLTGLPPAGTIGFNFIRVPLSRSPAFRPGLTVLCGLALIILEASIPHGAAGEELVVLNAASPDFSDKWTEKVFAGKTNYSATRVEGVDCVMATSNSTASGLYRKLSYNPQNYPYISWSWRIEHILKNGDARKKSGDDYAARLYVIFPSLLFWKTRVINYIWANKLPEGMAIPSSYTDNSVMIAVQSGDRKASTWVTETRNIYLDYQNAFGDPPPKVGAVALMTDTDNTGESTSACYGDIRIMSQVSPP